MFIAYGGQASSTTMSNSSVHQYTMSVSSSLPAVDHHPSDRSCDPVTVHHTSERSCDPITVLSDEEVDIHSSSDHMMSGENSSDHVMSGDSGDHTTTQRIKRKRRKLISSNKDLVSHWQPTPISIEGDLALVTRSNTASSTINKTDDISPITVEEHNSIGSHDPTTTTTTTATTSTTTANGRGSPTAANTCDLTTVEWQGSSTVLDSHDNKKHSTNNVTNNGGAVKSLWSNRNTQSYTRASLTSVKSAKSFYNQSNRPLYDFTPFTTSKLLQCVCCVCVCVCVSVCLCVCVSVCVCIVCVHKCV